MNRNRNVPPKSDEMEISIFGPGYGEALAIHLGNGKWILIDSCFEPNEELPASLNYLYNIEAEVEKSVILLVATHWHDDHVRGLALTLGRCDSAEFYVSGALRESEFLKLTDLYHNSAMMSSSGIDEFSRVMQLLLKRRQRGIDFPRLKTAIADRLLYNDKIIVTGYDVGTKVYSLSPSDSAILQSRLAFAELLPHEGSQKKRILSLSPNHTSVVLWIEIGKDNILLGADMEVSANPLSGWSIILDESQVINGKASVFKIPHHGSENGHYPRVWTELLLNEPYSLITPFRKGRKPLPSPNDIDRINELTSNAYATAQTTSKRVKWRNRVVRDTLKQATKDLKRVHHKWGHIRLRKKINSDSHPWKVELFGDAYKL